MTESINEKCSPTLVILVPQVESYNEDSPLHKQRLFHGSCLGTSSKEAKEGKLGQLLQIWSFTFILHSAAIRVIGGWCWIAWSSWRVWHGALEGRWTVSERTWKLKRDDALNGLLRSKFWSQAHHCMVWYKWVGSQRCVNHEAIN